MRHPRADTGRIVDYVDLEALDISKLDEPGGKQALIDQLLSFINKNGTAPVHVQVLPITYGLLSPFTHPGEVMPKENNKLTPTQASSTS